MSVEEKISAIHAAHYAAKGLTLDQLTAATDSIARHLRLDDVELESRLENVERLVKKLDSGPSNG